MSTQTTVEPVRRSVSVERPVEDAFRVFTEEIGSWWPLETHSRAGERDGVEAETAVLEGRVGGRLYERVSDGTEADWGTMIAWEPPHRLAFACVSSGHQLPISSVKTRKASSNDLSTVTMRRTGSTVVCVLTPSSFRRPRSPPPP